MKQQFVISHKNGVFSTIVCDLDTILTNHRSISMDMPIISGENTDKSNADEIGITRAVSSPCTL